MFKFNRTFSNDSSTQKHLPEGGAFLVENVNIERKAIKHLYLRIDPSNGHVRVSAPRRMKDADIARFLQLKQPWITRKRQQLQNKTQLRPIATPNLDCIRIWGQVHPVLMSIGDQPRIFINSKNEMCIQLRDGQSTDMIQQSVSQWLRSQLQERITERLPVFEKISGTHAKEWRIRAMKTRWGTCNIRASRIWINAELVQLPPECLDYIILHELVHLLEPSHNARFHALVTEFMPQWKEYDMLLKRHVLPR